MDSPCISPKANIDAPTNELIGKSMSSTETNYFMADQSFYNDPFPFLDEIRTQGRVYREPHQGVYMVTGLEDCLTVWRDEDHYSSVNTVAGPFMPWPGPMEGSDLTDLITQYRPALGPRNNQLVTLDGDQHEVVRALVSILFSPVQLKKVDDFIRDYANKVVDRMVGQRELEVYNGPAREMTFYVIITLLGVPMNEAKDLLHRLEHNASGKIGDPDGTGGVQGGTLNFGMAYQYFLEKVIEARENPTTGILSTLANARFRDGSLPAAEQMATMCCVLFGAGQESTARMITHCLRYIAQYPEIQAQLRADPSKLSNFVEEVLRYESPSKGTFRLAKRDTELAGVSIPVGSVLCLLRIAANRDPDIFPEPHKLDMDRRNARRHVAFGGGVHMCIGQSLARTEINTFVGLCLEKTSNIELLPGQNNFDYDLSYQLRGLQNLHLRFTAK
jgi:cytochrome P450 family 150 subfamily A5